MIIVTGGAGFIGSAFVWKLNQEGIEDIVIVDRLGTKDKWKNLVNRRFADFIHKDDFLQLVSEDRVPFKATAIIHMGACSSHNRARCRLPLAKQLRLHPHSGQVGD